MPAQNTALEHDVQIYCESHSYQFTEPRRHVAALVGKAEKPLSAYDILDALKAPLNNPKPPTIYRALEFLQQHGFVHRIESLNAYVSCHAGHQHRGSQFMICDTCGCVIEAHLCSPPDGLLKKAAADGFEMSFWNAEIHGICAACRGAVTSA